MKILLDTNALLWTLYSHRIPEAVQELIKNPNNELYISICSIWEIEIKHLKKPALMPISGKDIYEAIAGTNVEIIDVNYSYVEELEKVASEDIHYDPFDQMIIATAIKENMTILTGDLQINKYQSVNTILC